MNRHWVASFGLVCALFGSTAWAQSKAAKPMLPYPPSLPEGQTIVTDQSDDFLKPVSPLLDGVAIAQTAPRIDFMYYPGQDYAGKPWSTWGDGCVAGTKYYSAIGDHHSPRGTARVFEYDTVTKKLRTLIDLKTFLAESHAIPDGMDYCPAKIHSRVDIGRDGWLYFSGHRGSPRTTDDKHGFLGDWIFRTHPQSGKSEIVAAFPVEKHCLPCSVLDPQRLVYYAGTAHGTNAPAQGVQFLAYDAQQKKVLYSGPNGPARYMLFANSTGTVYYGPGGEGATAPLMKFHPEKDQAPVPVGIEIGCRSATQEVGDGVIYTVSRDADATLWAFNTKTEKAEKIGTAVVAKHNYITTLDADPTGRFLYYIPGAHGGAMAEGSPVVQFDVRRRTKKVIAFVHPFYQSKYGYTPDGCFSSAVDPTGERLYVTWNGTRSSAPRGSSTWESVTLTVIHIPASERESQ